MQAPQATLDLAQALEVGAKLKAAREALNLPASKVANILLLSSHQVESLEIADTSVFYNAQFYAQAADKYAAFLELTPTPSETLFVKPVTEPAELAQPVVVPVMETIVTPRVVAPAVRAARVRVAKQLIFVLMLLAMAVGAYLKHGVIREFVTEHWPLREVKSEAAPVPSPVVAPPPSPVVVETPAPVDAVAPGTVIIHFSGSSWVQVVASNGTKQEDTYKSGDTLSVEPAKLQALIIGNVEVAKAESAKGPVNLNAYLSASSKVARIIGPAARALGK